MRRPQTGTVFDREGAPAGDTGKRRDTLTLPLQSGDVPGDRLLVGGATPADPDDEAVAPTGRVVLVSAPKLRAAYWYRFWRDALRPEFYKNRPVVVVSRDNRMDGPALVVPLTTKPQGTNKWAYKLLENPNPRRLGVDSWAVCNPITPCPALGWPKSTAGFRGCSRPTSTRSSG